MKRCCGTDTTRLDAIWHLLGVSGWTIELLEKILKETVLFSSESLLLDGLNPSASKEVGTGPGSGSNPTRRPNSAMGDPFGSPGQFVQYVKIRGCHIQFPRSTGIGVEESRQCRYILQLVTPHPSFLIGMPYQPYPTRCETTAIPHDDQREVRKSPDVEGDAPGYRGHVGHKP